MKFREFFETAVQTGISNDPRGEDAVRKELEIAKKDYEALSDKEKKYFDTEALVNPYADSRMLYGTGDEEIKDVLVGIDVEGAEVVLADAMRRTGRKVDLLVAHHPEGHAFANLYQVMKMQADILGRFGVSISTAENLMEKRIKDVKNRLMPVNHSRAVDAARLLDFPFVCLHTPCDNMVATYLQAMLDAGKPYRVTDIIDMLMEVPEYQHATQNGAGPNVLIGNNKRTAGKVFVDMTGGTGGSKKIFSGIAASGINTIVGMHMGDEHRKEAEKHHINVVIAGHISSDNLGVNLLLDELSRKDPLNVHECSGFKRVSRL